MNVSGTRRLFPSIQSRALTRSGFAAAALAFLPCVLSAQPSHDPLLQSILAIQQHIQSGDLEGARSLIIDASRTHPAKGGLENLLGIVEIQENHVEQAKKDFADAIRHDPKLVSAYLNLARIDMESAGDDKQKQAETLHLYETALRLDPANAEANFQAANLLMWSGKYQSSLDHVARLKSDERNQPGAQSLVCADEAGLGHREAADRAAAALIANPDLAEDDAASMLPALRSARRADIIEKIYAAIDARHPLSPVGLRTLGLAREANGELPQARATLEKVFAADPKSVTPLVDLARIANAAQDYTGALGYLAHAREMTPTDASLPYEFGVICTRLNLVAEARKALTEAVSLEPNNPQYNLGLGIVASVDHDPLQALPYLQKFHELKPGDPAGMLALGTTYFRAKDYENAATWLQKSAASKPTACEAHYYLGRIARQKGEVNTAIAEFQQAEALQPQKAEVLAELGQVYVQTRNFPEATRLLEKAVSLDDKSYSANFGLLQLYARTGDPRRDEQAKRFDAIKDENEQQSHEMMRQIEISPSGAPSH